MTNILPTTSAASDLRSTQEREQLRNQWLNRITILPGIPNNQLIIKNWRTRIVIGTTSAHIDTDRRLCQRWEQRRCGGEPSYAELDLTTRILYNLDKDRNADHTYLHFGVRFEDVAIDDRWSLLEVVAASRGDTARVLAAVRGELRPDDTDDPAILSCPVSADERRTAALAGEPLVLSPFAAVPTANVCLRRRWIPARSPFEVSPVDHSSVR